MRCIYSIVIIFILHKIPTPLYASVKIASVNSFTTSERAKYFANTFYQVPHLLAIFLLGTEIRKYLI